MQYFCRRNFLRLARSARAPAPFCPPPSFTAVPDARTPAYKVRIDWKLGGRRAVVKLLKQVSTTDRILGRLVT